MTPQLPGVHDAEESAGLLKVVKPSWLKEQARQRRIPHLLISGKYAWTDEHLAQIIRQFERRPEDAVPPAARQSQPLPDGAVALKARRPRYRRAG